MVMLWLEGGQGEVRGACAPLPPQHSNRPTCPPPPQPTLPEPPPQPLLDPPPQSPLPEPPPSNAPPPPPPPPPQGASGQ